MKNSKHYVLATVGLAVMSGSLVLSGSNAGYAAPPPGNVQEVLVVNPAATPVRTQAQGTTTVAGTVLAQQTGTWNVGVTGTPTFQVGNAGNNPVPVRDVDNPARQPFTDTLVSSNNNAFTVPAGKRLVIEYVSGGGFITSGQKFITTALQCSVALNGGGSGSVLHSFTPSLMATQDTGNGPFDIYSISQQTRLYVEPGGRVEIFQENTPAVAGLSFTVSGYLVDVP